MATVRELGRATVAIDIPTREKIKKAAGDKPVSDFLRELFDNWDNTPGQTVMDGVAKIRAAQPASKQDIDAFGKKYLELSDYLDDKLNRLAALEQKVIPNGPFLFRTMNDPPKVTYTFDDLKADIAKKKQELSELVDKAKQLGISDEEIKLA